MVTWTINRAFLLELKDANPDYWNAHSRLEQWLASHATSEETPSEQSLSEVVPLVRNVREELRRQFMLEETYGYMQTPVIHSLTFSTQVEAAYNQHKTLYLLICEMNESAERAEYQGKLPELFPHFVTELTRLLQQWSEHEQIERQLIFESR
jgi:hypothetical protein